MSDLIDRDAAIEAIEYVDWYHQNQHGEMVSGANSREHQAWYRAEDIYDVLERLPSAQPERKNGEWERASFYNGTPVCSECYLEGRWDWDFCPNCGADMRGGKNEQA